MKITPALEYEKLRQDADSQNKIILHKDGKFYHVYEWSAWLLKNHRLHRGFPSSAWRRENPSMQPLQLKAWRVRDAWIPARISIEIHPSIRRDGRDGGWRPED